MSFLNLENVTISFGGIRAVKNVSLDIRQAHRHSGMLAVWQDFGQGTDHLNLAHSCNGGQ